MFLRRIQRPFFLELPQRRSSSRLLNFYNFSFFFFFSYINEKRKIMQIQLAFLIYHTATANLQSFLCFALLQCFSIISDDKWNFIFSLVSLFFHFLKTLLLNSSSLFFFSSYDNKNDDSYNDDDEREKEKQWKFHLTN